MPTTDATTMETSHKGDVPAAIMESAVEKVTRATDHTREPVRHIDLRLILEPDPARPRPAISEVGVDVDGVPIRAQVAAGTLQEAVDLLVDRLARRIRRYEQQRHRLLERYRTGDSGPGEWRHGDLPTSRPDYFPRPYEEREVVRTKALSLEAIPVERAIVDLELLDHHFYLFVDRATDVDAVLAHDHDGEIVLRVADPDRYGGSSPIDGLQFDTSIPPQLSLADAKEHIDVSGEPYLFFRDARSGRGQVLYRRYDGHYGLVAPT